MSSNAPTMLTAEQIERHLRDLMGKLNLRKASEQKFVEIKELLEQEANGAISVDEYETCLRKAVKMINEDS